MKGEDATPELVGCHITRRVTDTSKDYGSRPLRWVWSSPMASSSSTGTLSQCERLPDELLLRVLEFVMPGRDGRKRWRGAVRGG